MPYTLNLPRYNIYQAYLKNSYVKVASTLYSSKLGAKILFSNNTEHSSSHHYTRSSFRTHPNSINNNDKNKKYSAFPWDFVDLYFFMCSFN